MHPLRPQLVEIYLKYNQRKLQTVDKQLAEYAGREAELLAHLEEEYGPLDKELQRTFTKVAAEERRESSLRAPGVAQQQPRRLDPLPGFESSREPLVLAPAPMGPPGVEEAVDRTAAPLPPPPIQKATEQDAEGSGNGNGSSNGSETVVASTEGGYATMGGSLEGGVDGGDGGS